jgi:hypothetical protein
MRARERFVIVTNMVHYFLGSPWYTTILNIVFCTLDNYLYVMRTTLLFSLPRGERGKSPSCQGFRRDVAGNERQGNRL